MQNKNSQIAIFALQGAFVEHQKMMEKLDAKVFLVRSLADVQGRQVDGVILPGGESTTMTKMLRKTGLDEWLKKQGKKGLPIFGTCAGVILLSDMELIDIEVDRNAYGSQLDSFEAKLRLETRNSKIETRSLFNGVFIRAPKILSIEKSVEILAEYEKVPVLVRQKNILAASFHPELTEDDRIHRLFLDKIVKKY